MPAVALKTLTQVTVAATGTEVAIATSAIQNVVAVHFYAPAANTGTVYVGDSSVTTANGIAIEKGTKYIIEAPRGEYISVQTIFVDAATNGDKLNVAVLQLV